MSYIEWIRSKVGTRKIFLTFASVVLRDENGRILLQKRTDFGIWGLPGGVLETDEDILTCARRELREETGLAAGALRPVGVYCEPRYDVRYPNGDQVQQFTVCFQSTAVGGQLQADGLETSELAFVAPEAVAGLPMDVWYREMIRDALRGGPPVFAPPFRQQTTSDQIAAVRPFIGTARYIGVGATAAVQREDGRLLMLQHVGETAWRFPAGFTDLGENVAHTAVREVREETGLHVRPERIIAIYTSPRLHYICPNGDQVKNAGVLFRARLLGGEAQIAPREIAAMRWVREEEVLGMVNGRVRWFYEAALAHLDEGIVVC